MGQQIQQTNFSNKEMITETQGLSLELTEVFTVAITLLPQMKD